MLSCFNLIYSCKNLFETEAKRKIVGHRSTVTDMRSNIMSVMYCFYWLPLGNSNLRCHYVGDEWYRAIIFKLINVELILSTAMAVIVAVYSNSFWSYLLVHYPGAKLNIDICTYIFVCIVIGPMWKQQERYWTLPVSWSLSIH